MTSRALELVFTVLGAVMVPQLVLRTWRGWRTRTVAPILNLRLGPYRAADRPVAYHIAMVWNAAWTVVVAAVVAYSIARLLGMTGQ